MEDKPQNSSVVKPTGSDYRETLYTVDKRGRRKWVYAAIEKGRFFKVRSVVAYLLMAFYLVLPWISINGKQAVLFEVAERRFIIFGAEFWATDTQFLFLVLALLAFSLFFFTALLGRVWCGWACPETVFLEFLFRPIERLIEGGPGARRRLDAMPWNFEKIRKKFLKHGLCAFFSWVLASTALAYVFGRAPLLEMMTDWPHKNLGPFLATTAMMGLMAFQFGWFREQFCTVLCPYARFQSVLMDSNSLVVGYDVPRGEPRAKLRKGESLEGAGDCIDCKLCVRVCPTGIDIRNGLQLECIACTACIDACDSIMNKIGKAKGLIRYDTEDVLLGRAKTRRLLRPRPVIYGLILLVLGGALLYSIGTRSLSEFKIVRVAGDKAYTELDGGKISNHFNLRISNKSRQRGAYFIEVLDEAKVSLITPENPVEVPPSSIRSVPIFLNFDASLLSAGKMKIEVNVRDKGSFSTSESLTLIGPGN